MGDFFARFVMGEAMQVLSRLIAFVLISSVLILSAFAADDKNKKADPPKDAGKKTADKPKLPPRKGKFKELETDKDAAEKKMLRKAKLQATIVAVVEDKKSLRLRLTIPYIKINEGQLQAYYKAQTVKDMLQAQAQLYELAKVDKEVEWAAAEELKVRMRYPPPQFDSKGKPKRYSAKELRELKGNDKQPGYPAEFSDLKAGQIVEVTLLQKKKGARPVKRGKDGEGEVAADDLPKMSLIMITYEPKN